MGVNIVGRIGVYKIWICWFGSGLWIWLISSIGTGLPWSGDVQTTISVPNYKLSNVVVIVKFEI